MSHSTIRDCRPAEAADVLALWLEHRSSPSRTDTVAAVSQLAGQQPPALLVAEIDERIVGTIIAAWDGWRGNIYRLVVHPDYRRRGIATELAKAGLERLRERGAQRISLLVIADDEDAVAFWDSLAGVGFQRQRGILRYTATP